MTSSLAGSPILSVRQINKRFKGLQVLTDVTLDITTGKTTALIGTNGAGKSTFLNIVSGFLRQDSGEIEFAGRHIEALTPHRRARLGLSRSFQHPRVFGPFSVRESVMLALTGPADEGLGNSLSRALRRRKEDERLARAEVLIASCHLAHRADDAVGDLSYGEQKLVMLAQVLALGGRLLCLDELCAGVGEHVVEDIKAILKDQLALGVTILFIEHNLELVCAIADNVLFLHQGQLIASGGVEQVLEDPEVVRLYLGQ
jgi:branched-chain amino acid transport system ATP-binding protein